MTGCSPGRAGLAPIRRLTFFERRDDFAVIAEVPGINKSNLEIQAKGNTLRIAGTKSVNYERKRACIAVSGWPDPSTVR